jgi:hypothetical protein
VFVLADDLFDEMSLRVIPFERQCKKINLVNLNCSMVGKECKLAPLQYTPFLFIEHVWGCGV